MEIPLQKHWFGESTLHAFQDKQRRRIPVVDVPSNPGRTLGVATGAAVFVVVHFVNSSPTLLWRPFAGRRNELDYTIIPGGHLRPLSPKTRVFPCVPEGSRYSTFPPAALTASLIASAVALLASITSTTVFCWRCHRLK